MTSQTSSGAGSFDYFAVVGPVDASSECYFKDLPSQVRQSRVVFDFSGAGRINSMGIALLLRCFKEVKEMKRADIALEGVTPMHTMLFKMTGIFLLASPVAAGTGEKGGMA